MKLRKLLLLVILSAFLTLGFSSIAQAGKLTVEVKDVTYSLYPVQNSMHLDRTITVWGPNNYYRSKWFPKPGALNGPTKWPLYDAPVKWWSKFYIKVRFSNGHVADKNVTCWWDPCYVKISYND